MIKQILAVAALLSTPALAETPWLVKSQNAGFVMPAFWQTFTCSIYADRVEIQRSFGQSGLNSLESRPVTLAGDVAAAIRGAALESLTDDGTLCDAPGTRITAYLPTDSDSQGLLLLGRSTCSQDGERKGEHSTPLIALANALCGSM